MSSCEEEKQRKEGFCIFLRLLLAPKDALLFSSTRDLREASEGGKERAAGAFFLVLGLKLSRFVGVASAKVSQSASDRGQTERGRASERVLKRDLKRKNIMTVQRLLI